MDKETVMSGGPGMPGDSIIEPQVSEEPVQGELPIGEPVSSAPTEPVVRTMIGEIRGADALTSYTKQLEEQLVQARSQQKVELPTASAPQHARRDFDKEIEENWYTNPRKARELMREQDKVEKDLAQYQEQKRKEFFDSLYRQNPDLKSADRVVQLLARERAAELNAMPLDQAEKFLARSAREIVSSVKGNQGTSETLPRANISGLGGSGATVTTPKKTEPRLTFVEQLSSLRKRGKK